MSEVTAWFMQPWAERLGWTLMHFVWEGAAIAAVLAVARAWMVDPRSRHAAACMALASMALAPAVTFAWLGPEGATLPLPAATNAAFPVASVIARATPPAPAALSWLVMGWIAGVAVFSVRLAGGWLSTVRLRHRAARPAPPEWQERLDRLARTVGVPRRVRLLVAAGVDVPAVLGWLRPVVLAPVGALTGLPAEHVEALLAHELAHIRRNDYLVSVLQGVAEAVLFYHPAVWWVSKQIRMERELCCDDLAVMASGDVLIYARALAELETCRGSRTRIALAADGGSLLKRIARLVEPSRPATPGPCAVWVLGGLLMLGIGAVTIHGAQDTPRGEYPTVGRDSIWTDTVKQGDVPVLVRGLGQLTSATTVELSVAQSQMKNVQLGQAVKVGFPRSSFVTDGRVTGIRPDVGNGVVIVDMRLDGVPESVARPPAQADGTIQVGALTNVVYVGRPVLIQADQEGSVFRIEPDGKQAVRTKVMFGRGLVNQIEIRSGLQPGDRVILSDMTKYKDAERVNLQ